MQHAVLSVYGGDDATFYEVKWLIASIWWRFDLFMYNEKSQPILIEFRQVIQIWFEIYQNDNMYQSIFVALPYPFFYFVFRDNRT